MTMIDSDNGDEEGDDNFLYSRDALILFRRYMLINWLG